MNAMTAFCGVSNESVSGSRIGVISAIVISRYTAHRMSPAHYLTAVVGAAFYALLLSIEGHAQQVGAPAPLSFEIVPGTRLGPIRETTSRRALATMVPPNAIVDTDIPLGEGFCTEGTRVFSGS